MIFSKRVRIYFIGILGSSMSSLALMSAERGHTVAGSDLSSSDIEVTLSEHGISVNHEQAGRNITDFSPDVCVYSMAISEDNEELVQARRLGVLLLSRAEYMAQLISKVPLGIAVCGSHGKSTVVAMLYSALLDAGLDVGVLSGAKTSFGYSYAAGDGAIVYEACEYCNSFLCFSPDIAVVTNLELDHTDFFRSLSDIKNSFLLFINSAKRFAVINADDENLLSLLPKIRTRTVTVGRSENADFRYERYEREGKYRIRLYRGNSLLFDLCPSVYGEHNAFNLAVSLATVYMLGLKSDAAQALSSFAGIERRCQPLATLSGVPVIYDYAHHPTEISATMQTLREMGYERVLCVFCPHTYSRTKAFSDDFAAQLSKAKMTVVVDIYPAREKPIEGVSSAWLCEKIKLCSGNAIYLPEQKVLEWLCPSDYDCILLMGAGNLDKLKNRILKLSSSK